ncbi:protein Kinase-like protein TMKL1 precursor [Hordeum vulgare]|nr:protein Kinase-like protein TMKL1 precursor [Hordeum vulgare]
MMPTTMCAIVPHYLLLFANFFLLLLSPSPTMTAGDVAILMDMLKPALQGAAPNAQLTTWNASMPLCLWRGLHWSTPAGQPLRCDTIAARANLSLTGDTTLLLPPEGPPHPP